MSELLILAWLCKKYVQRADDRQKAMGLQYTEAETHDLAREFYKAHVEPLQGELAIANAEITQLKAQLEDMTANAVEGLAYVEQFNGQCAVLEKVRALAFEPGALVYSDAPGYIQDIRDALEGEHTNG